MKTPMPDSRAANGSVGFALQILLVLLILATLTGQVFAATCPVNMSTASQTGNAIAATGSSVTSPNNAKGAIDASSATIPSGKTLTLDLGSGNIVPGGATVTLTVARSSNSSSLTVTSSLDNSSYAGSTVYTAATLGSNGTLKSQTYTIPSGGSRYIKLKASGDSVLVDGVEYSQICQLPPKDYGDAPDTGNGTGTGNYQTKSSDGGPSHTIIPGLMLGSKVDADSGLLQNATATADDTNGSDDEDGLLSPPIMPTTAGQTYTLTSYVTNTTGSTAYLTAYIDFNRDGDFLDPGEKSDTPQYVYWNGYFLSSFTLPSGLTAGTVNARLRLSQTLEETDSPVGDASSGEVEDYQLTVSAGPYYDFGDAPSTYGSARHTINNSLYLGDNRPDAESTSQYSYNASGDGYDEDSAPKQTGNQAITLFPVLKMTATSYSVNINITNTTGSIATLYGWIDFNQDGVFQTTEAKALNIANNTNGKITLTWDSIPTNIKLGTTFIRLRLTTDSSVKTSTPSGNASDGEVEDFPIAIAMDIPPDSPNVTIVKGDTASSCSSTVFTDDFNDLPIDLYFGQYTSATPYVIRNWTATGGGNDTYASTVTNTTQYPTQGTSIYFGNGFIRRIYPDIGITPEFDANGRMLSPPDAIELRDNVDDTSPNTIGSGESDWGPEPVKLSRTFATTTGQKYRLYFSAIPEDAGNDTYRSGIMRVDTPSGSIHFKAPGGLEGMQKYRIEFTAMSTTSTISFVNYGHIGTDSGWCDPTSIISGAWCSVGGSNISRTGNELIIDDVTVAQASTCLTSNISGKVYVDKNANNIVDTTDTSLGNITVTLYDNNGTTNTTTDDTPIASTSTAANGIYSFTDVSSAMHYRIEVDTRDKDLPVSAIIGTTNPLANISVNAGGNLTNQNFGFDLACDATLGQFGGIAFRDYNQNGTREPQEEGIAGITVTAYDSTNTSIATATTDARGWYKLSGLSNGVQYRLEYTSLPSGLASGASGMDTASNVRFITAAADCAAHYSVSDPVEYCQATPYVATSSFTGGNPALAASGSYTSIHTFPYTAEGEDDTQTVAPSTKATAGQTGALWGMAYQKPTKTLYTSAAMRRFAGLGSLGTGGIYKVDMSNPTANSGASAYVDVRTLGIPTGNDVRTADACNSVANSPWDPAHDVAAWDAVGKIGIGDIDYDETNNRLWLVNLNDRKLYGIKNISPSTTPTSASVLGGYAINLPSPYTCTSGTFRPWAVKYHRGLVYVGGVCDAATDAANDPSNIANLKGYVLKFDPANTAAGFSYVKHFAFDQKRPGYGYDLNSWSGWFPPTSAIGWPYFHSPIVGNLEFDSDDSIIVGIIDRAGLQNGNGTYDEPSCTDTTRDYTDALGDVLRLCKTDSGYITDSEPGCTTNIPTASKVQDEYYWGDMGPDNEAWQSMNEIANGGLALAPGKGQVLISSYDAPNWGSNSVVWLNNTTGAADSKYHVDWSTTGKSAGMGELEVLCDPAPIEVGNRVWLDSDKDGIQNAGEPGINDVTVTLACNTDSATTTTNTAGEYYFSNKAGGNATFMSTGKSCTLSVLGSQTSVSAYTLTTQNADSKTDNNSQTDIRDSDAANNSGTAVISFTISGSGQNNHSLDFGYRSNVMPGNISGTVYTDSNGNNSYDSGTESGLGSITVSLYSENFTPTDTADDTLVTTTNTAANGSYSFSSLDTGMTYRVEVDIADSDLPAGTTIGTTNPLTSTLVSAGATTADKNFGFDPATTYTNGYCVTPSGTTGLLDLGNMSTAAINGAGTFSYTNRVLPGYGTVNVSVNMTGGIHSASTSAIDTGTKQQSWLNENLPASGTAIYLEPNSNGSATVTYNFAQPTGNVDLLMLDVDESDSVKITALDANGNAITDFSGWRYRSGDLSVWQNPSPVASAPAWNSTTATLTSTNNINDHRSFGLLTPNTLVTQVTVNFSVAALTGQHVYTTLYTTATGRDGETSCPANTTQTVSGKVFEDKDYGGGAGRALSTAGTAGVNGARVELYSATGAFVSTTTTAADGTYTLNNLTSGDYYVRVANATVKSTRSGSNGTELGVQTYRTDGTTAATGEVGGRKPAVADAGSNTTSQTLNTTTFLLSGGGQAQSVQALTVASTNLSGVDFGFNFDTIVNANDNGQGSLRQFILNANLLGSDSTLAQTGRTPGRENAILMLATTDPNYNTTDQYWSIAVQSALPSLGDDIILDASTQPNQTGFTFANRPVLELNGTNAGQWNNGLILNGATSGSTVKYLAINRFSGAGIKTLNSQKNVITANYIGTSPLATVKNIGNAHGIDVISPIGLSTISNNLIAYNNGNGVNAWNFNGVGTTKAAIISGNSIYANIGLGIDLLGTNNIDGVTVNDSGDTDTGANELLNFPILSQTTLTSGNLTIKGCAPAGATVELFKADVSPGGAASTGANKFGKTQDYGEGQTYLASFVEGSASDTDAANCALATDADGNNQTGMKAFSVTIPQPTGMVSGDMLTTTATVTGVGTSEFSPTYTYNNTGCSLVVNSTADTDNIPNNSGSLRDAIQCANSTPAADTITFNIPTSQPGYTNPDGIANNGDEYWSIQPSTPLPGITQPLVIDGSTQPSTTCPKPRIEIDGSVAGVSADGIGLYTSNSTIKGLIINNFGRYGVLLSRFPINFPTSNTLQTNNTVQCSYVGVNASGLVAKPNLQGGIAAEGDSMKIGGTTPASRNIISGNSAFGIYFAGGGSTNGTIQGNYIGVGADGTTALGNTGFGIGYYNTDGSGLIGGTTGVTTNGACTGACNIIAYNSSAGVGSFWTGPAGRNIRISANAIHSNGGIGIDLERSSSPWVLDGVNPNDTGDSDSAFAPNGLQNYPILNYANLSGTTTDISGTLNSIANATFTLEFFTNTSADPSGYGEGERYLGNTTVTTDSSGNAAFTVSLPAVAAGTYITSTATDATNNTSEFSSAIAASALNDISGKVFEDVNYGGDAGRAFSAAGSAGVSGVQLELYNASNALVTSTTTAGDGTYTFTSIPTGSYQVKVISNTVKSTRPGSNGTELGVMTYRTDSVTPTTTVGGAATQTLTLANTNLSGVDFGFNFDTVTNTNDSGAGSLRQFLLNANLLGGDTTLAQTGHVSGKENAILMLPTTDPNYNTAGTYWSIPLQSTLPAITSPLVLDGSLPAGSNTNPALELKGTTAGTGSNGLTLNAGADGSTIRKLAINGFGGAGIYLNGSNNNSLQANKLGATPTGVARANTGAGILLNASSNNLIGGTASGTGNVLANNAGDGIAITGATSLANSILGNSIYKNTGLGIDLGDNGVTANDVGDADTGANDLLNFPEVKTSSFGANGTKIVTYDFDLDAPAGDYRLEFFASTDKDPSGNGEGEVFIGSKDISHLGTGSANFKGTLNANMTVLKGTAISTTLTQKTGASSFGATSEFSGIRDGITTQVCDSLVSGSGSDMVIDETNPTTIIKLLEAFDYSSTPAVPITYVISGGADGNLFTIENPTAASTLPCATIKFISNDVVITKAASEDVATRAGQFPTPGNYELPMDSGKDNIYDLQVTGTTATGKKYVRDMSVRVMDTNEAPIITSAAAASFKEDTSGDVLTVKAQDADTGDKLTYSISGGADAKQFEMAASTGILRFRVAPDYDAPMDTNRDNLYEVEVTVTDTGGLSHRKLFSISVTNNTADDGVSLNVRALLQGAYDSKTALLSDDLRRLGLVPSKQPYNAAPFNYAGAETLSTLLQETTGNNAVVDWVLVELRSSTSTVVASRAVMLQRNGTLVDSQTGSATLHFAKVAAGNYYVSVRHRNHLGVITASPVSLSHTERLVDFTASTTAVKGEEARFMSGTLALMWAGDINANNTLTANGPGNDVTSLLSGVIGSTDNVQGNTNHILSGYLATDLTMDGKTLFTGPGNDTSLLVGNIILHPLNTGFAANYIVRGGL